MRASSISLLLLSLSLIALLLNALQLGVRFQVGHCFSVFFHYISGKLSILIHICLPIDQPTVKFLLWLIINELLIAGFSSLVYYPKNKLWFIYPFKLNMAIKQNLKFILLENVKSSTDRKPMTELRGISLIKQLAVQQRSDFNFSGHSQIQIH